MDRKKLSLKKAIIESYRRSIYIKYGTKKLRRYSWLDTLSDNIIIQIRNFFLDHLYPPVEKRHHLDDAFDHLRNVLTSPKKMISILKTTGMSLFRLGTRVPAAIRMGIYTVESYLDIRKMEKAIFLHAIAMNINAADLKNDGKIEELIIKIPEKDILCFRREILNLLRALSNIDLLQHIVTILHDAEVVMRNRQDIYTEDEIAGIGLGTEMLTAGIRFYKKITPKNVYLILRAIETTEKEWYDNIKKRRPN